MLPTLTCSPGIVSLHVLVQPPRDPPDPHARCPSHPAELGSGADCVGDVAALAPTVGAMWSPLSMCSYMSALARSVRVCRSASLHVLHHRTPISEHIYCSALRRENELATPTTRALDPI